MATTVIRVFDEFDDADGARNALLAIGIPADCIEFSANGDEAGPVEGNGWLDDKDTGEGPPGQSPIRQALGIADRTDAYNNSEPVWRSYFIMTVQMADDAQEAEVARIMAEHKGMDVEARNARARPDTAPAAARGET